MSKPETDARDRRCQGPHGWCGKIAIVVCTAVDGLQWYACEASEHRHGAHAMTLAQWWTLVDE